MARFRLNTLDVSLLATGRLKLHYISVGEGPPGQRPTCSPGVGTAALQHLCRTADHYGLAIELKIMPGDQTEASAARLAGWYRRHGFDIRPTTPGAYLEATGVRAPR